jgi:hypothetical protein
MRSQVVKLSPTIEHGDRGRAGPTLNGSSPFALLRLAHWSTRPIQMRAAGQVVAHAAAGSQDALVAPLAHTVGDRSLVVVPTGWLQSCPWSLLPACSGRPVSGSPSASLWMVASRRTAPRSGTVVVGGPGLASADAEAAVAALYPGARLLTGAAASSVAEAAPSELISRLSLTYTCVPPSTHHPRSCR